MPADQSFAVKIDLRSAGNGSGLMLDDHGANFGLGDEGAGDERLPPVAPHGSAAANFLNRRAVAP